MNKVLEFWGLDESCSIADIKTAYHRLAKKYHPDHGGTASDFILLGQNYEWLLKNQKSFINRSPFPKNLL